jgi:hypothetical protein
MHSGELRAASLRITPLTRTLHLLSLGFAHDRCTHLVEDNSGVGSECIAPGVCATNFPGPTGLASAMNRSLWLLKGQVISTEQRALNNIGGTKGFDYPNAPIGLIGFGPNVRETPSLSSPSRVCCSRGAV